MRRRSWAKTCTNNLAWLAANRGNCSCRISDQIDPGVQIRADQASSHELWRGVSCPISYQTPISLMRQDFRVSLRTISPVSLASFFRLKIIVSRPCQRVEFLKDAPDYEEEGHGTLHFGSCPCPKSENLRYCPQRRRLPPRCSM